MRDPRAAFFRDLGPKVPMPIELVKPPRRIVTTPAPTQRAQYDRDRRAQLREDAARRSPEGLLRRHGITLTTVHEDPVEWALRVGMPFRGDAA